MGKPIDRKSIFDLISSPVLHIHLSSYRHIISMKLISQILNRWQLLFSWNFHLVSFFWSGGLCVYLQRGVQVVIILLLHQIFLPLTYSFGLLYFEFFKSVPVCNWLYSSFHKFPRLWIVAQYPHCLGIPFFSLWTAITASCINFGEIYVFLGGT